MFQCLKLLSGSFTEQSQLTIPSFMFLNLGTAVAETLDYLVLDCMKLKSCGPAVVLNQRCIFLYSVFVPRQWQWAVFTYSWRIVQTCVNYWAMTLHTSAQYCEYMMNVCFILCVQLLNELSNTKHVKTDINIDVNKFSLNRK